MVLLALFLHSKLTRSLPSTSTGPRRAPLALPPLPPPSRPSSKTQTTHEEAVATAADAFAVHSVHLKSNIVAWLSCSATAGKKKNVAGESTRSTSAVHQYLRLCGRLCLSLSLLPPPIRQTRPGQKRKKERKKEGNSKTGLQYPTTTIHYSEVPPLRRFPPNALESQPSKLGGLAAARNRYTLFSADRRHCALLPSSRGQPSQSRSAWYGPFDVYCSEASLHILLASITFLFPLFACKCVLARLSKESCANVPGQDHLLSLSRSSDVLPPLHLQSGLVCVCVHQAACRRPPDSCCPASARPAILARYLYRRHNYYFIFCNCLIEPLDQIRLILLQDRALRVLEGKSRCNHPLVRLVASHYVLGILRHDLALLNAYTFGAAKKTLLDNQSSIYHIVKIEGPFFTPRSLHLFASPTTQPQLGLSCRDQ